MDQLLFRIGLGSRRASTSSASGDRSAKETYSSDTTIADATEPAPTSGALSERLLSIARASETCTLKKLEHCQQELLRVQTLWERDREAHRWQVAALQEEVERMQRHMHHSRRCASRANASRERISPPPLRPQQQNQKQKQKQQQEQEEEEEVEQQLEQKDYDAPGGWSEAEYIQELELSLELCRRQLHDAQCERGELQSRLDQRTAELHDACRAYSQRVAALLREREEIALDHDRASVRAEEVTGLLFAARAAERAALRRLADNGSDNESSNGRDKDKDREREKDKDKDEGIGIGTAVCPHCGRWSPGLATPIDECAPLAGTIGPVGPVGLGSTVGSTVGSIATGGLGGSIATGGLGGSIATGGPGGSIATGGLGGSIATGGLGGSIATGGLGGSIATGGLGGSIATGGLGGSIATGGLGGSIATGGLGGSIATGGLGGSIGSIGTGSPQTLWHFSDQQRHMRWQRHSSAVAATAQREALEEEVYMLGHEAERDSHSAEGLRRAMDRLIDDVDGHTRGFRDAAQDVAGCLREIMLLCAAANEAESGGEDSEDGEEQGEKEEQEQEEEEEEEEEIMEEGVVAAVVH